MLLLPDELELNLFMTMMLVFLLLRLDHEESVSLLADLSGVSPPEVLFVFWD